MAVLTCFACEIQHLRYSYGEPVLDSPFSIFCHAILLAVAFRVVTELPQGPQTIATDRHVADLDESSYHKTNLS